MEPVLAETAGFCFGVRRAVDTVYKEIEKGTEQVYTYGPIIHNELVVNDFARKGVHVIEDEEELKDLKEGTVIIRSHGAPKRIYDLCEKNGLRIVDATCPFVKKIHRIVVGENTKGRRAVIVGDPDHPEVAGIRGWGDENTCVIRGLEDLEAVPRDLPVSIVAQTTYNYIKLKEIIEKISTMNYDIRCFNTVCNATQERQTEAAEIASRVDTMIVIGSKSSSNTKKLCEICRARCSDTMFIQSVDDLYGKDNNSANSIGITAGASTPEQIIEEVQNYVRRKF